MDGRVKISHEQRCYKIYELARAFVKFSVLNLTANLKDEVVKFKKANPALSPPNSPPLFKIKLRRRAKFASKFDKSAS
nr:hypothetical protein [uncultured Campylobacter sp.]